MKNLKSILIVFVLLFFALTSSTILNAIAITTLEIKPVSHQKVFLLSIRSIQKGEIKITILNKEENQLFVTDLRDIDTYEKRFNLEKLKMGSYALVIEDEFKIITQPFEITYEHVEIDFNIRKEAFKPYTTFHTNEKYLDVNWLILQQENYVFEIRNNNNTLLYADQLSKVHKVNKRYNISELPEGIYFLKFKAGEHTYYKTIRVGSN